MLFLSAIFVNTNVNRHVELIGVKFKKSRSFL